MVKQLVDRFGRVHRDMRISVTDRCSLRCTYCMPAEGVEWLMKSTILTGSEIARVARVAMNVGITKFRLTGGEPLLHPDIVDIVRAIYREGEANGGVDISITTNGIALAELAGPLQEAGLNRINVSLDTVDPLTYRDLTRRDKFADVMAGLEDAKGAGLEPVKLNAVAIRGINDAQVVDLVRFAMDGGYHMRFIEHMPLDAGHTWNRSHMVTQAEILARLRQVFDVQPVKGRGAAPAELFEIDGGPHRVGIIASVTAPFCGACDRVRLTADGQLRSCLFSHEETDLRAVVRGGGDDSDIVEALYTCVSTKKATHGIGEPGFVQPQRPMSAIGG